MNRISNKLKLANIKKIGDKIKQKNKEAEAKIAKANKEGEDIIMRGLLIHKINEIIARKYVGKHPKQYKGLIATLKIILNVLKKRK